MIKVGLDDMINIGFNIIPIKKGSKAPSMLTWRKYMNVKYNKPLPKNSNYAVILGNISGFIVIDSDSEKAEEYIKKHFPETSLMVKTRKGFHRYYRTGGKVIKTSNKTVTPFGESDLKAEGGYCLIPPSKFVDPYKGEYEWVKFSNENVPVFDENWLIKRPKSKSSDITKLITNKVANSILTDMGKEKIILGKGDYAYNIYVKDTVKILEKYDIIIDYDKTGPMKSNNKHINGYMFVNHTGIIFASNSSGIFAKLKFKLEDQIKTLRRAI